MLHKPVYSPENERVCLSVMSLAANESGQWHWPRPLLLHGSPHAPAASHFHHAAQTRGDGGDVQNID